MCVQDARLTCAAERAAAPSLAPGERLACVSLNGGGRVSWALCAARSVIIRVCGDRSLCAGPAVDVERGGGTQLLLEEKSADGWMGGWIDRSPVEGELVWCVLACLLVGLGMCSSELVCSFSFPRLVLLSVSREYERMYAALKILIRLFFFLSLPPFPLESQRV